MRELLFNLFGIKTADAAGIIRTSLSFHGLNPLYVFAAALALGALVFWMYQRTGESLCRPRLYSLAGLRALFLLLLLGLLLRPVLSVTFESSVRRSVLLLFDTSRSMSEIRDQRLDDDLARAALVRNLIDPAGGLRQPPPAAAGALAETSRLELVQSAFTNVRLNLLPALAAEYNVVGYTFDRRVVRLPRATYIARPKAQHPGDSNAAEVDLEWIEKLEARGDYSAIGDAVREVISQQRGQPVAGVVLITDGASNSGTQPLDAAILAGQDKVPLYIWGVGITAPRDIVVGNIFAQEVAFADDEVPVSVRVRSTGMAGQSGTLSVTLGDERAEMPIDFHSDGEQIVTVSLTPKQPGAFEIQAAVGPRGDEANKQNNAAQPQKIRIIDGKIKVLMVEQSPRWEFKYAQAILMRDRRIDFKCILLEADASITRAPGSPYISEFPQRKEDLFKYDLIILGDVDPQAFSGIQLENLNEFVSRFGGAVVVLAGKRFTPAAYRRTVIEKMLPVELESLVESSASITASRPVRVELTPAGKSSAMLRLAQRELDSLAIWNQLPPIYWVHRVSRAKPAAEVLLVDPDPSKASRYGKMPIIALQQYGLGQVLYIGTDNLWRWRRNTGDRYHSMLWGQVAQRMALPHLLGATKRTQLSSDRRNYTTGQTVTIFARLYTEGFEPMNEEAVRASYVESSSSSPPRQLVLRQIPDQPGMYKGELIAPGPGEYELRVEHDRSASLEFGVADPQQEIAETAMNIDLLRKMAEASGGHFFREEDLHTLPGRLGSGNQRREEIREVEIWSSPLYFLLMLGVVTAEWGLRKLSQLK